VSSEHARADFESRSLSNAGLRAFVETNLQEVLSVWPPAAWDLTNLTLAAFYFHPDLDVARASWSAVEAGKVTARQRPNPTLSAAPGYNPTTAVPTPWFATFSLDIPIETAGKRGYRIARAEHLSESARMHIAATAWQVRTRLRRALVDFAASEETERLLACQQTTQTELLRLIESQVEAGEASPYELTQARLALSQTRLAWQEAQGRREEARARLAAAIGVPLVALETAHIACAGLGGSSAALPTREARRHALMNRADLLGALADYAASESALQLEIAKQYPDVRLNPGYKFDQGDNKWSLGLTVTLPILNQNQGPIAVAEARRAEAEAQFNALQARVIGEVDRALAAYRAARATMATAEAMTADLEKQERAAQARWDAGDISKLQLSAVRVELNAAALARQAAWVQAQQAFGDLEDALQIPIPELTTPLTQSPRTSMATTKESEHD
jgi:outer membrane protein TolC